MAVLLQSHDGPRSKLALLFIPLWLLDLGILAFAAVLSGALFQRLAQQLPRCVAALLSMLLFCAIFGPAFVIKLLLVLKLQVGLHIRYAYVFAPIEALLVMWSSARSAHGVVSHAGMCLQAVLGVYLAVVAVCVPSFEMPPEPAPLPAADIHELLQHVDLAFDVADVV